MKTIDVNSDLGEGFGPYVIADDAALMPLVKSSNMTTSGYAGDPATMDRTLTLASENAVRIGPISAIRTRRASDGGNSRCH